MIKIFKRIEITKLSKNIVSIEVQKLTKFKKASGFPEASELLKHYNFKH